MKIEFNKDGSIKMPWKVARTKQVFKELAEDARENPYKVVVEYDEVRPGYEDDWSIYLPSHIPSAILYKLKKWADEQHEISVGRAWITRLGRNSFILNVKGRKNRCTWAHAFLNGLNTALIRDFNIEIELCSTCKHDFRIKER